MAAFKCTPYHIERFQSEAMENLFKNDNDPFGIMNTFNSYLGNPSVVASCNASCDSDGFAGDAEIASNHRVASDCECGGTMSRSVDNLSQVCTHCGIIQESNISEIQEGGIPTAGPARLRIVGKGSRTLEPDLFRSGTGNTTAAQKKLVFDTYKELNQQSIRMGGRAFPLDACTRATDLYNMVQAIYVQRSQNKLAIMAACLWYACMEIGNFAPSKKEVAKFMNLTHGGIARGENVLRKLIADKKISEINMDIDSYDAEIVTLFALLGKECNEPEFDFLRAAIREMIAIIDQKNMIINAEPHSKIMGAAFIVLRRCAALRARKTWTVAEFCTSIRKNTIDRIITRIGEYHRIFTLDEDPEGLAEPAQPRRFYEKWGLDAAPFEELMRTAAPVKEVKKTAARKVCKIPAKPAIAL